MNKQTECLHIPKNVLKIRVGFFFYYYCSFLFLLFMYLFLAALGLHCCTQAFSSCGKQGATLCCGKGASLCSGFSCGAFMGFHRCSSQAPECRLSSFDFQALEQASVVVAQRLSCPEACGIFLDQGSSPCPLHWQASS